MLRRCLGCMDLYDDKFDICPNCGYVEGVSAEEMIHMPPGTLLHNRYLIGKVLGYGGFGSTYIAWDKKLEQKVAIKEYMPGEFSTRMAGSNKVSVFSGEKKEQFNDGLRKFVDEARRLAKFQNEPGIIKIFDTFEDNNTAYIVMEYLEGENLASYLKSHGTIQEDMAIAMLMPIMDSLKVVHAEGILHRDICPENIFITHKGEFKLIDFGASRYATTSHSRSLTVIVKPGYSPEEQYRSRGDQGPHTDVYAIAATLYKMITGKTPPDAMERRAKYENQNKDILAEPHTLTKEITRTHEVALLNALNVRIEDRTPDIDSFLEELNADEPAKRRYGKIKKIDIYAWPLWLKILIPTLLVAIVTFGVLLLTGVINFSRYSKKVVIPDNIVIAPDVEGARREDALEEISKKYLNAVIVGNVESDYIAPGKVMTQTPVGGAFCERNGVVYLTISSGNGVVEAYNGMSTIPYLIGDTKESAIEKCRKAGLGEPVFEEISDDYVAAGLVVSTSTEGGEQVPEGSVITIRISTGPAAFPMPDVVGKEEGEARTVISESGLMIDVQYDFSADVPEGHVISQSIAPNTDVRRGDRVSIVVSTGEKLITVPDVVGSQRVDAEKALKDLKFEVYIGENFDNIVPAGCVISQVPEAGSSQKEGITVTIIVSKGAEPTPTPVPATPKPTRPPVAATVTSTPTPTLTPTPAPTSPVKVNPSSLSLSQSSLSMLPNETKTLTVTIAPADTTEKGIAWSSSNTSVATVDSNGIVTSVGAGTATITATSTADSSVKAICEVTVEQISISGLADMEYHAENGGYYEEDIISVVTNPSNAEVTWTSSNPKVLSVYPASSSDSSKAAVLAQKRGTATLTASITVNGVTVSTSCEVRCYNNKTVYSDWSERKYQLSPVTESSTVMKDGDENVEVGKQWILYLDYYLYTTVEDRGYYANLQSGRTLTFQWSVHANGGDLYDAPSSDGVTPDGWVAVPPGGRVYGDFPGFNGSSVTGYRGPDGSNLVCRIFFVKDREQKPVYEHRYYYRTRTAETIVTCEED